MNRKLTAAVVCAVILAALLYFLVGTSPSDTSTQSGPSAHGGTSDETDLAGGSSNGDSNTRERGTDPSTQTSENGDDEASVAEDVTSANNEIAESHEYWVSGNVVTDNGTPFPGATVELLENRGPLFTKAALEMIQRATEDVEPLAVTRSAGGGAFRLPAPGPGRYDVRVTAREWVGSIDTAQLTTREKEIALWVTIYPGLSIAGVLQDSNGSPLRGSTLVLLEKARDQTRRYHRHMETTAGGGHFRFDGLSLQRYILLAKTPGGMTKLLPQVVPPTEDLIVRMDRAVAVSGIVTDSATEAPIAGALVSGLNPQSWDQVTTDAEGQFELNLAGNDADILVVHDDYAQSKRRVQLSADEHAFALDPATPFTGRVMLSDGTPASGATVGFFQGTSWLTDVRTATADTAGNFTIPLTGSGALLARVPGWTPQPPFDAGQGDLVLVPSNDISGAIYGPAGRPVANAYLRLHPAPRGSENAMWVEWLRGVQEGWTDDNGEFIIVDVVPIGAYELEVVHDDFADYRHPIATVSDEPMEINVPLGGTLSLDIVTPDGSRPAGVVVAQFPNGPRVRRRHDATLEGGTLYVIPADGFVQMGNVPTGQTTLYVRALPFLEEIVQVSIAPEEDKKVEVKLRRGSELSILVVTPNGESAAGIPVTLSPAPSGGSPATGIRVRTARTGGDGAVELSSVAPGTYRVSAQQRVGDTGLLHGSTTVVVDGKTDALEVDLPLELQTIPVVEFPNNRVMPGINPPEGVVIPPNGG